MPENSQIKVNRATSPPELEKVYAIRTEVFVHEQHCPADMEWEFEEESNHFLAMVDDVPTGAARWRKTDKGYKLERFAVLKQFRGMGVGHALVQGILNDLPADARYIYLHAQVQAMPLYAKSGFVKTGPEFEEAGIRHYKMEKNLGN
jgi:predicted GNAT family N-acyltransferase